MILLMGTEQDAARARNVLVDRDKMLICLNLLRKIKNEAELLDYSDNIISINSEYDLTDEELEVFKNIE